jgi:hypothetical protein
MSHRLFRTAMHSELMAYNSLIRCRKTDLNTPSSNSCKRSTTSMGKQFKPRGPSRSAKVFCKWGKINPQLEVEIAYEGRHKWKLFQKAFYSSTLDWSTCLVDGVACSNNSVFEKLTCSHEPSQQISTKSNATEAWFWKETSRTRTNALITNGCNKNSSDAWLVVAELEGSITRTFLDNLQNR